MDDIVQKKVDELVAQSNRKPMRKPSGQIVQKSAAKQAFEKFFELDATDLFGELKTKAKRAAFNAAADVLNNAVDSIFRTKRSNKNSDYGPHVITRSVEKVSYRDPSVNGYSGSVRGSKHTFSDLMYSSRSEAVDLLEAMRDAIRENGSLSVTELYDGIGDPRLLGSLESTDSSIGWKELPEDEAFVAEENGMYRVFLPKVVSLK